MSMSNMFWWDLKSSKSKEPFKFHSPYSLLICSISACSQHQNLLSWLFFSSVYNLTVQKERTKERKKKEKELFFSNRELLSTRKHWTINPSLAQAHHRHYRHIAFISFQHKISTPFRKLSTKKYIAFNSFLFCFNLFQISLQCFMCKNNGEMVWHEDTRRRRYNALKLSCITTKYVFWSPIFPPETRNCLHQIDPFPARNNPSNACLCILPLALLSSNRVSPLNETLFQSTHRQMKWRLAHCT